ncbi:MAG: hypothetical protein KBT47_05330 [Armatimonadetes bacterium]|nr:hypothetical protein [Candidatus Hippobium faecium]
MAKRKGPETWQIPTEDEVNELYGDDEKQEKKEREAEDRVNAELRHVKTIEESFQEKKTNIVLTVTVIAGIIIALVIISAIMVTKGAKKGFSNMESGLNSHNSQTMQSDFENENPEGENIQPQPGDMNTGVYPDQSQTVQDNSVYPNNTYPQPSDSVQSNGQAYPQTQEAYPSQNAYPEGNVQPAPNTGQTYPQAQDTYPQTNPRQY